MFKSVRPVSENIIASILYALFIVGGGALLALLKSLAPNLFIYALWGLIGSALTAVIVVAFIVLKRIPKRLPETTPQNVESNIREWLDVFRLTTQRLQEPSAYFGFLVTSPSGMNMVILRSREFDRYVLLRGGLNIAPEDKKNVDALSDEEKGRLVSRLTIALSRSGMGFEMDWPGNRIALTRRLPITANLTEASFMEAVEAMDVAKLGIHRELILMLSEIRPTKRLEGGDELSH